MTHTTHATWICSKCDTTYECGSPCRLHAAAPELLAALEGLSKAVVAAVAAEPHIFLGKEIDDAQYKAIDAIASAVSDRDPVQ